MACFATLVSAQDMPRPSDSLLSHPHFALHAEFGLLWPNLHLPPEVRLTGSWTTQSGWNLQVSPGVVIGTGGTNRNFGSPMLRVRVAPKWTHGDQVTIGLSGGYRFTAFERDCPTCQQPWDRFLLFGYTCNDLQGAQRFTFNEELVQKQLALSVEVWNKSKRICYEGQFGFEHIKVEQFNVPEEGFPGYFHPKPRYSPREKGSFYRPFVLWGVKLLLIGGEVTKLPKAE